MKSRYALTLLALPVLAVSAMGQSSAAPAAAKPAAQAEAAPEPKYKVGDVAPDFTMKDQNRQDVTLSSFKGKKNVVLAFYIFAFTGG
jgi:cytochrome oxidase Cu insertion factor (SCO1/SenC/PrrC family)